jgi:hypothetical protein
MEKQILQLLIPAVGLISGLVATYVSLQNRALLAEVRKELAELENRLILRINGTYIRRSECQLKEALTEERLDQLMDELKKKIAAGG